MDWWTPSSFVAGVLITWGCSKWYYQRASRDLEKVSGNLLDAVGRVEAITEQLKRSERAIVRAVDVLLGKATDDDTRVIFDEETGLPTGGFKQRLRAQSFHLTNFGAEVLRGALKVEPSASNAGKQRRTQQRLGPRLRRH